MKTAEEFKKLMVKQYGRISEYDLMIKFAQYHVDEALSAASRKAKTETFCGESLNDYSTIVDKSSILNSYPLKNITKSKVEAIDAIETIPNTQGLLTSEGLAKIFIKNINLKIKEALEKASKECKTHTVTFDTEEPFGESWVISLKNAVDMVVSNNK